MNQIFSKSLKPFLQGFSRSINRHCISHRFQIRRIGLSDKLPGMRKTVCNVRLIGGQGFNRHGNPLLPGHPSQPVQKFRRPFHRLLKRDVKLTAAGVYDGNSCPHSGCRFYSIRKKQKRFIPVFLVPVSILILVCHAWDTGTYNFKPMTADLLLLFQALEIPHCINPEMRRSQPELQASYPRRFHTA